MSASREDIVKSRLYDARDALDEARLLADGRKWKGCANRLYYACFHAATALLHAHNLSSSKHSGVRSLMNQHFVKSGKLSTECAKTYNTLFELRLDADYADLYKLTAEDVEPLMSPTEAFIDVIDEVVTKSMYGK